MTIADLIEQISGQMNSAVLSYGHGTDNARDEAVWLVLQAMGAPVDGSFDDWGREVAPADKERITLLAQKRCEARMPLAYLLGTAWFAGLEFEVNESVLVPRSPMAELIQDQFRPWLEPDRIRRMLDLCTGSACIAIASAHYLPGAHVDASDISDAALEVARRNVRRHGLQDRVEVLKSDLFTTVPPVKYDLIVSNPPYVPAGSLASLPPEYRAEPGLGLASGDDGLDAVLSMLLDAPGFLGEDGVFVCEVGESEDRLAGLLPTVPFIWLEFTHGGNGVFVLTKTQLDEAGEALARVIGKRKNVV